MKWEEAEKVMLNGGAVESQVSFTVYEMLSNGVMLAEGNVIDEKHMTIKEVDGEWKEVRVIKTKEEYNNLTDLEKENILASAYKKHQFDLNRSKDN